MAEETPIMFDYPLAGLVVVLLAHTAGLFFFGGKLSQTVSSIERMIEDHEVRLRTLEGGK